LVAKTGAGFGSVLAGVFERIGVTPDGSGVVFEVTNQFQLIGKTQLADEQRGFFFVRRGGSGLHRLGQPSSDPTYRIATGRTANFQSYLPFSPSGRLVAYTDVGPAPDGSDATQIFTLDVGTGQRTQVTSLPPRTVPPADYGVWGQAFLNEQTIQFHTRTQEGDEAIYTIRTDGSGLRRSAPPQVPESVSASSVLPVFGVSRPTGTIVSLALAATPENTDPYNPNSPVVEVFRTDGANLLQLTTFGRYDTYGVGGGDSGAPLLRGRQVLLVASGDPFGENPFNNCQLFSTNFLGGMLRQLTRFDEGTHSVRGCIFSELPGCSLLDVYQDPTTRWIVFYSNCNPVGRNPNGSQVFAMRPDGGRLRQLTNTAGARFGTGDEVDVEIPGPIAYSRPIR